MALRVRWGNVGRAAGGVALVGLVVAWPRLAGPVPVVPGGEARPMVDAAGAWRDEGAGWRGEVAEPVAIPRKQATPRKRATPPKRGSATPRKRRDRRTALVGRDGIGPSPPVAVPGPVAVPPPVAVPGPVAVPPPVAVPGPVAVPPPVAVPVDPPPVVSSPSPTVDAAEREFGFER